MWWMFSMNCFRMVCAITDECRDTKGVQLCFREIENALAQIELVQARLEETQMQMQKEIELLQAELRRNQDPERMQLIQEMISVRIYSSCIHHNLTEAFIGFIRP